MKSNIKELLVKKYYWINAKNIEPLFAVHCIITYRTGRVVSQTYYNEEDIPYTVRDYMNMENFVEASELPQPSPLLQLRMMKYKEE